MIAFSNCKINIGLNIIRKRNDNFHDIETIFYPVKLYDAIEVIENFDNRITTIDLKISGISVEGNTADNFCVKAYNLLKKDFPSLPSINMHLHKTIPTGAGLGGGSANAAFTLKLLNKKFNLNIPGDQLMHYALKLGSDCPFFILNEPCFATGRGEILKRIDFSLKGYSIVLVNPGIHINTAWAFSQITPNEPSQHLNDLIKQPISSWKELIRNDFENPIMNSYPLLHEIKEKLYSLGSVFAAMSGSGSTMFGIFSNENMPQKNLFSSYWEKHIKL